MPEANLPFAEAMALDPSDVEYSYTGAKWSPLVEASNQTFGSMRHVLFRLSRPRRSRVQEMADVETGDSGTIADYRRRFGETAIRAVCEYLRTKQAEEMAGPCGRSLPETQAVWAARIEREFLEPR